MRKDHLKNTDIPLYQGDAQRKVKFLLAYESMSEYRPSIKSDI